MTPPGIRFADLGVRILSAAVLVLLAFLAFWKDIFFAVLLCGFATCVMLWEFRRIVLGSASLREPALWVMMGAGAAAVVVTGVATLWWAVVPLAAGIAALAVVERPTWRWMAPALFYIAFGLAVLVDLRRAPDTGVVAVLWLILVVVAVDVGGYFAGRTFGGPKLAPRISPSKTWAGVIGGLVLAALVGLAFSLGGWGASQKAIILISLVVALASQMGDLLESALKRHFGVKDSSRLIPGHGGLLDRFDGLLGGLLMVACLDRLALVTT
ncbi:MAG: phosphatidate cytidylyltransferase [Pseudomonadota bacterium]